MCTLPGLKCYHVPTGVGDSLIALTKCWCVVQGRCETQVLVGPHATTGPACTQVGAFQQNGVMDLNFSKPYQETSHVAISPALWQCLGALCFDCQAANSITRVCWGIGGQSLGYESSPPFAVYGGSS